VRGGEAFAGWLPIDGAAKPDACRVECGRNAGTFLEPNGGRDASVAVSWLDWQLKGDKTTAKRFTGKDCGLCQDPLWKVERKKID
jgi:hypothetical protein